MQAPALQAFALSRVLLLALTAIVAAVRHMNPLAIWNQWDSLWYSGIAEHGYAWGMQGRSALAFFPLFPAAIHLFMALGIPPVLAGLLVSNLAFLAALFYLHGLASRYWDGTTSTRLVLILALAPTAFFTFAPYTESLFLLCTAGALYHAQKNEPIYSGVWLAGALLTRSTGIILVIPILLLLHSRHPRALLGALGPTVLGWALYLLYLQRQHIALSGLIAAQRGWHRELTYPWVGFTASLHWLVYHGTSYLPYTLEDVLQLAVTVICLGLTAAVWRSLPCELQAYCAGFWAIVLPAPQWQDNFYAPLSSMDRFVLVLFPAAAWLACRGVQRSFWIGLVASAVAMLGACTVYLAGGWVG